MAKKETKNKRNIQAGKLFGLGIALVDLAVAYVLLTQDARLLWGFGGVLVLQAGYWFVDNVILSSQIKN